MKSSGWIYMKSQSRANQEQINIFNQFQINISNQNFNQYHIKILHEKNIDWNLDSQIYLPNQ